MNATFKLTIALLLFAFRGAFAQSTQFPNKQPAPNIAPVFHLKLTGGNRVAPDQFWKYKKGDDLAWAQPDTDDQGWPFLDLNQSAYQLPQLASGTIIWLRLHFTVDSTLQNKLPALLISQSGASEIYLDGKRIQQFGLGNTGKQFSFNNPHNVPVPLLLSDQETHLLAIRFVSPAPANNWILQRAVISPLSVSFQLLGAAMAGWEDFLKLNRTTIGFAFLTGAFCLLFFSLFIFYPKQKLNFFFGLFNFFYNLNFLLIYFQT